MNAPKTNPQKSKLSSKENNPFCNKSTLSYYLHDFVNRKGFKESSVYKAAGIGKNTWSNIYSGFTCPDQLTARKLVIGLKATYDEACQILQKCGYTWSETSFDECIINCLKAHIYIWNDVLSYIQLKAPEWLDGRFKKLAAQ